MENLGQSGVNAGDFALSPHQIETLALSTWPGNDIADHDGWLIRRGDGHGHRPNSVATVAYHGTDLAASVRAVEAAYRGRGLRPMFHISPATAPSGLDDFLAAEGYQISGRSWVYGGDADRVAAHCPPGDVKPQPEAFERLVLLGSHSPADGRARLAIMAGLTIANIAVVAFHEGVGRACGHGGLARCGTSAMVAVNLVRSEPGFRRLGLARQVMGALARWSLQADCSTLTLCVEDTNAAARALYEAIGFRPLYPYAYRVKA